MLGSYSQPNNRMLHGWVLAEKDETGEALKNPIDLWFGAVNLCKSSKKVLATFRSRLLLMVTKLQAMFSPTPLKNLPLKKFVVG